MASYIIYEFYTKQKGFEIVLEPSFTQYIVWSFICVSYLMNTAAEENDVEQFSSYSSNFHPYSLSWDTFIPTKCGLNSLRYVPLSHKNQRYFGSKGNIFPTLNVSVHEEIVPHFLHIICCKTWKWTWTDIRVHMKEVVSCYYTFILHITAK